MAGNAAGGLPPGELSSVPSLDGSPSSQGFFSRMFSKKPAEATVAPSPTQTSLSFLNPAAAAAGSPAVAVVYRNPRFSAAAAAAPVNPAALVDGASAGCACIRASSPHSVAEPGDRLKGDRVVMVSPMPEPEPTPVSSAGPIASIKRALTGTGRTPAAAAAAAPAAVAAPAHGVPANDPLYSHQFLLYSDCATVEELEHYIACYYRSLCDPLHFVEDVILDINNDTSDADAGAKKSPAKSGSASSAKPTPAQPGKAAAAGGSQNKAMSVYIDRDKFFKYIMALPSADDAEATGAAQTGTSENTQGDSSATQQGTMSDGAEPLAPPPLQRQVSWEDRAKQFDKFSIFYDDSRASEFDAPQQEDKVGILPYLSRRTGVSVLQLLGVLRK